MENIRKYLSQDIDNPNFLFHGSPKRLERLVPHQANDSDGNENNIANAIFLFPSFLKATPYAFKDIIKEMNEHYNFIIPNTDDSYLMRIEDVEYIDENMIGYIYVFKKQIKLLKMIDPTNINVILNWNLMT